MSGWRKHHATGSDGEGYLDPELTIDLPADAHDEIHDLLRGARLDDRAARMAGPRPAARGELRLRRLAPTLEVAADLLASAAFGGSPLIVASVTAFLFNLSVHAERWANELADACDGREA
jgi:hypothetical protein